MAYTTKFLQPNGPIGPNTTTPPFHHARRSDSKISLFSADTDVTTTSWTKKTQAYMDSLVPPSREQFEHIARIQEQKEQEMRQRDREHRRQLTLLNKERSRSASHDGQDNKERDRAARLIQKTFRGHRTRREMEGYSLDASSRWMSAIREAEFRQYTTPRARSDTAGSSTGQEDGSSGPVMSNARRNWKKASIVARRAGHDDVESDISSVSSASSDDESPEEKDRIRKLRDKLLAGRRTQAQMMGLQYFLEMVDVKHRYGSNLRTYHSEWLRSDTTENFFYWLDIGEGKNIELDSCPRDRLEREKVRYLSREERQYYLVKVDDEGRLRWAKNGVRIDTTEKFKDSIHGIVPADDPTPAFNPEVVPRLSSSMSSIRSRSSSLSSLESRREADRAAKYNDPDFDQQPPMKKITHFSASTIWNKMLRKSVRDGTWIFVADTSFRLYVGIKASGAFQHSSFLQGSRISAAGLIKIKNGRISSLSPLSGHYRPPTSNFRAFVRSLKEAGVDMSHVSISKAYAVLVGLEVYVNTRKKSKKLIQDMMHRKDKVVAPEVAQQREEEAKDTSQSAQREREVVQEEEAEKHENKAAVKVMRKLKIRPSVPSS